MLPDGDKTKEELSKELAALRLRIAELEQIEAGRKQADEELPRYLEGLVGERTAELKALNWHLQRQITERQKAEEALREAELQYRTVADFTYDWESWENPDGTYRYVSPSCERITGYEADEFISNPDLLPGIVVAEDKEKWLAHRRKAIKKRAVYEAHFRIQRKDSEVRWIEHACRPVIDDQGIFLGYRASNRDITERKKAKEVLQAEKNKLQSLIDALEDDLSIQDKHYNIIYQNERSRISSGGDRTGEKCYQAYEGEDEVCPGCPVEQAFKDGKSHTSERKWVKPSGEVIFWETTVNPVRDAAGNIVSCLEVARNITERKRAEEAVRESEEKLRKTFESVIDAISVIDLNGIITEVNQRTLEMHGFSSRDELLGKSAFELVAPRDHGKIATNVRKALKQGTVRGVEYTLLKSDGSEFPGELSTSVLKDASGNPVGHVTISRDITERKQAGEREEELQEELNLASRLAAVGELAAGVAHEMNNPLTGILGFSERLSRKSTDDDTKESLELIHHEAQRLAKVVKNLLTFARRREPRKEYADINDILQRTLELRAYELKTGNIEVTLDLAANLPEIMVDFHQIQEVFVNIILNAEQVMTEASGGGELTIKTRQIKDYLRISFTDDGPGIPAKDLGKVFNPFFTTKGERGGTGLGLSVCHGIVTEHGGRIYARSKPGSGATFLVDLPLTSNKTDESQIEREELAVSRGDFSK